MSKEAGKDNQTAMQKTMLELEAKNAASDGMLFATLGKGKSKVLIFPTPIAIQENGVPIADRLLTIMNDGYRAIQISRGKEGLGMERIVGIVEKNLGRKYGFFSPTAGYTDRKLRLEGSLVVTGRETKDYSVVPLFASSVYGDRTRPDIYDNCRLVNISGSEVEEILAANISRVEAVRVTSQKVSQALSKAS